MAFNWFSAASHSLIRLDRTISSNSGHNSLVRGPAANAFDQMLILNHGMNQTLHTTRDIDCFKRSACHKFSSVEIKGFAAVKENEAIAEWRLMQTHGHYLAKVSSLEHRRNQEHFPSVPRARALRFRGGWWIVDESRSLNVILPFPWSSHSTVEQSTLCLPKLSTDSPFIQPDSNKFERIERVLISQSVLK